ncbi:MAG: VWA domain-containing protein [Thiohalocapsa sp.]|nr:VWA domain-containing protein [Thiohalocapsa sp.]
MKTRPLASRIIGTLLFGATAAALAYFPLLGDQGTGSTDAGTGGIDPAQAVFTAEGQPLVEAVFVLDTTGSMGGMIQAAKDKIWSIATTLAMAEPAPQIRMGLVAYRDRGDDYVTRVTDLTADLDSVHAALFQLQAAGGGDGPESVNQALDEAVNRLSWSTGDDVYRVVFLVGDAPAHRDYQDDVDYPLTLAAAKQRGIRVNAVQCGDSPDTRAQWRQIAAMGSGAYLQVAQDGAAVAVATPYDEPLARLSADLDKTRLYYGSAAERAKKADALGTSKAALEAAPASVLARRATFSSTDAGKRALIGDNELVDAVASGRVALSEIDDEALPQPLQSLSADARSAVIADMAEQRARLQRQIEETAAARARYISERVAADGGAEASLERQLFDAVREQAGALGLDYRGAAPAY